LVIRNVSPACATLLRLYDWDRELRVEHSTLRAERVRGDVSLTADSCVGGTQRWAGDRRRRIGLRSDGRGLREAGESGEHPAERGVSTIDAMRASLGHLVLSVVAASSSSDDRGLALARESLKAWDS
jgi:hypothetical protein